jgi:4-aminobutyrate aminotransferase-like enzyme
MTTGTPTKRQVKQLMERHGIAGELSGQGTAWQVELPDERQRLKFRRYVGKFCGYMTGYGAYVLRPGYVDKGDWNDRSSRHHY